MQNDQFASSWQPQNFIRCRKIFLKYRIQRFPTGKSHRWALSPISVISDIGLSLISELPISDWESGVRHYIGYRNKVLSDIRYPTSHSTQRVTVAQCYSARWPIQGARVRIWKMNYFFLQCRISEWAQMSISEHFRYRNDVFQSDIFVSDIGITDVDVDVGYRRDWARCRCPPMFNTYLYIFLRIFMFIKDVHIHIF